MSIFSYHLVEFSFFERILFNKKKLQHQKGLLAFEVMNSMKLGAPIYALNRYYFNEICFFAQWENEEDLDSFLQLNQFGRRLNQGWHIRLELMRKWGNYSKFNETPKLNPIQQENKVIGFTIASMDFSQLPRFIKWGKPVEDLVKNHPKSPFARASINFTGIISTFSIWETAQDMSDMVKGHSKTKAPTRHIDAMKAREQKDFYREFSTYRFHPLAEFGQWKGKRFIFKD